jgi:hypothetical protein
MKKLILVLALIAVYGIAISNVSAKVTTAKKAQITVVADSDNFVSPQNPEKKKTQIKKACCSDKAADKACCDKKGKACSKDCKKECCKDSKKECSKDCKKECCKGNKKDCKK